MLLTILNPPPSLWTHPPSCAASGLPPFSPRPSNGSHFYYLGWWDIHKERICQQDGKHVSRSVLMCLLERSLKSNRASGIPLSVHRGRRGLASSGWGELVGNARCDRFIDGSLLYWFPATEPIEHLCMSFSMTHLRATVPLQEALRDQRLSLAVPAVGFNTMAPAGWRIAALCQEKPLFALIGSDAFDCAGEKSFWYCTLYIFFSWKCLRLWWRSENDGIRGNLQMWRAVTRPPVECSGM